MKALILAAGKGTRLGSLTENYPKPMLAVGGQPLLAHHMLWLRSYGVSEVAINLHHAADVIREHFGGGSRYGVKITYSFEPELLGTAGAAKRLESFLDERFVVVYGDVFTNVDLARLVAFHETGLARGGAGAGLTMSLYRVPNPTECGLVDLDPAGRVLRFVEKPPPAEVFTDLANSGILVCDPALLQEVPAETVYDFGRDLLPRLLDSGRPVFGLPLASDEYVIDIGTPMGYSRAQKLVATQPAV